MAKSVVYCEINISNEDKTLLIIPPRHGTNHEQGVLYVRGFLDKTEAITTI